MWLMLLPAIIAAVLAMGAGAAALVRAGYGFFTSTGAIWFLLGLLLLIALVVH